jgi:uncharacterized MAPEG superfamily protein
VAKISIAIYCMMAASLLPFVWMWIAKIAGGFRASDNANPRAFLANTTGLAARANAAQANSFETLPVFLAAVLIAEYLVVPQGVVNKLAMAYVGLRVLYGLAYLGNWSSFRSVVWTVSFACPILLFILAARVG